MKTSPILLPGRAQYWADVFKNDYLNAPRREKFDTVDHEFNRQQGPSYEQSRAFNTILFVSLALAMHDQRGLYGAGAISKGALPNLWAKKEGPFRIEHDDGSMQIARHVYDSDETIGSLNSGINIQKNLQIQRMNVGLLRSVAPELGLISPGVLQGAISVAGLPNFDLGSKRRDKHFMQVWTPVIRELSNGFPVMGDWFFSGATSGLEYPEAIAIVAGLRKRRPDADMRFFGPDKKDVSLYDMSRSATEYLFWARENDFYLKHEATALARNFAIAEMARRGELPNGNPIFLKGIAENERHMRALQKEVEPLLIDGVFAKRFRLDTTDLADINPGFVEKIEAAKQGIRPKTSFNLGGLPERLDKKGIDIHRYTDAELEAGDIQFRQIASKVSPTFFAATANDINKPPMPPIDMSGKDILAHDGRSLFSRPLLTQMNERERQQAIALAGGLATPMGKVGRVYYVAADDRCGDEARRVIDGDRNLAFADEVAGKVGAGYNQQVRLPQRQAINALPLVTELRAKKEQVMLATDFTDMFDLYGKLPAFSVAPGEARPSANTELFARRAWMTRNATDFVFPSGHWEQSAARAQDIVIATRMQLGLQAGSVVDPYYVRIMNEKGQPLTIAGAATALYETLQTAVDKGRRPQRPTAGDEKLAQPFEEATNALAQLSLFHRMRDPALRTQAFTALRDQYPDLHLPKDMAWERISPFAYAYDHRAFNELYEKKILPLLEGPLAPALRIRHTEPFEDIAEIRRQHEARQRITGMGDRVGENRSTYAR